MLFISHGTSKRAQQHFTEWMWDDGVIDLSHFWFTCLSSFCATFNNPPFLEQQHITSNTAECKKCHTEKDYVRGTHEERKWKIPSSRHVLFFFKLRNTVPLLSKPKRRAIPRLEDWRITASLWLINHDLYWRANRSSNTQLLCVCSGNQ